MVFTRLLVGVGVLAATVLPASSLPVAHSLDRPLPYALVADGCGPGAWRGPWGNCRDTPYSGPLPGGGVAVPPATYGGYYGNGCPPGFWRGPYGNCRDTPYHGRLPDGSWQ